MWPVAIKPIMGNNKTVTDMIASPSIKKFVQFAWPGTAVPVWQGLPCLYTLTHAFKIIVEVWKKHSSISPNVGVVQTIVCSKIYRAFNLSYTPGTTNWFHVCMSLDAFSLIGFGSQRPTHRVPTVCGKPQTMGGEETAFGLVMRSI